MEKLDINSFTKEQIAMAAKCKTPDELIELAKKGNIELTKEQAEAYLAELENVELDEKALEKVAGGSGVGASYCPLKCSCMNCHDDEPL